MDNHALLKQLGFGSYEAKAYVALLENGAGNGYAIAKQAGIPRANVYGVLRQLVERGAAQRFDADKGVHYTATPAPALLARLKQDHQQTLSQASAGLAAIHKAETPQAVFNLRGRDELMARARAEIDRAERDLLVAIQPGEAGPLAGELQQARSRGVAITTLCMEACANECGGCQGTIHRLDIMPAGHASWLLLVVDGSSALLGQQDRHGCQGIVTTQALTVELTSAYIRQSLALALLGNDLAGRFDGLLSAQAKQTLQTLYPDENFLARIQSLGQPSCT